MKTLKNPKSFIDYSQTIDNIYDNLKDYKLMKKRNILIVFDYMKVDTEVNKKLSPLVTELFLRGRNSTSHLLLYYSLISKCQKL